MNGLEPHAGPIGEVPIAAPPPEDSRPWIDCGWDEAIDDEGPSSGKPEKKEPQEVPKEKYADDLEKIETDPDVVKDMNEAELRTYTKEVAALVDKWEGHPEVQQALLGEFEKGLEIVRDNDVRDNDREIANAIVDSGLELEMLSQGTRQDLLRVFVGTHDGNMGDEKRGPKERFQEVMDSLIHDPNLDKEAFITFLSENIKAQGGISNDPRADRFMDFATDEQLDWIPHQLYDKIKSGQVTEKDWMGAMEELVGALGG